MNAKEIMQLLALIAAQTGQVPQAAVDAAAATLDTLTASVVAATPKA